MADWVMIELDGKEVYLNDVLVELPDYSEEPFEFELEDCVFTVYPENAVEFCMDYSRDNYSQEAVAGAKSLESLKQFASRTGDIISWKPKEK